MKFTFPGQQCPKSELWQPYHPPLCFWLQTQPQWWTSIKRRIHSWWTSTKCWIFPRQSPQSAQPWIGNRNPHQLYKSPLATTRTPFFLFGICCRQNQGKKKEVILICPFYRIFKWVAANLYLLSKKDTLF